jgi:hypothetical protein
LCHSDLFPTQTELKVIGHMSDPNSKSSDILSDGPVKDILRPGGGGEGSTAGWWGINLIPMQSNACARARKALLALGKLTTGVPKFRGSGSLSACTIDKR